MKLFKKGALALSLAAVMMVTACGGANPNASSGGDKEKSADNAAIMNEYPSKIEHEGDVVDTADTLYVGVASDDAFKGIFQGYLYSDAIDDYFMKYTMNGAFPVDGDYKLELESDTNPIKVTVDLENKLVNYKINPKFKWSNGEPVTTADIVKTYEIVANQEYIVAAQSVRYSDPMKNIVGIEEYNQGTADKISGLEVISDSEMNIHMKEMNPSIYWGSGTISEFVNAKQYEGIPMNQIHTSDPLRKNPLSYGPYVMTKIDQGERVTFEANPHYYRGEAKVKNLVMEIVPTSQQVAALQSGKYDILIAASTDSFPQFQQMDNISIASKLDLYMSYLGFNLGKWDEKNNINVPDPNAKMADVNLRKAMGHAIDTNALGENFYHGLRFLAVSPIAPNFATLHDPEIKGYYYDEELSKKLLDEAGYKDVDDDGFREDKEGNPLVIKYAGMAGGEVAEPIAQYYLQQWAKVGLKVELVDGRLMDLQNFYDRVEVNDPAIDVFGAAWGMGSDPNPSDLYGKGAFFNMQRYTSDALQTTIDSISSSEALDEAKMVQFYHDFEKVFMDEAPAIPLQNKVTILPVNKRVKMYDYSDYSENDFGWDMIELTADAPITATTK